VKNLLCSGFFCGCPLLLPEWRG